MDELLADGSAVLEGARVVEGAAEVEVAFEKMLEILLLLSDDEGRGEVELSDCWAAES
jgi:hypothetical protein